jgi:gliding motility-associated-like protein
MFSARCLIFFWCIVSAARLAEAQTPAWGVNAGSYQYTMSVVAFLNVDSKVLTGEHDKAAAFVGGEVRGVASPIYVPSADRYLAYMTVFANKENEDITFKIYDSATDRVVDVDAGLTFKIDAQHGNVFRAFSLANPALNDEAEIKNFFFAGIDSVSTIITDGQVDVVLEYDQELVNLTPEFIISEGAKMFIDRTPQEPGAASLDFNTPLSYSVLSEDESLLQTYQVTVSNRQVTEPGFKSSNVITANNDGSNDYWIVADVFKYKDHEFKIVDVNGRILFESTGYNNDWNAYYNGNKVERGKYFFVISDPVTNSVIRGDLLVLY